MFPVIQYRGDSEMIRRESQDLIKCTCRYTHTHTLPPSPSLSLPLPPSLSLPPSLPPSPPFLPPSPPSLPPLYTYMYLYSPLSISLPKARSVLLKKLLSSYTKRTVVYHVTSTFPQWMMLNQIWTSLLSVE